MGKVHISDDFKQKMNRVLSIKTDDFRPQLEIPSGPAPKWKMEDVQVGVGCEKVDSVIERGGEQIRYIKLYDDDGFLFERMNYLKYAKIVFVTSVVGGIGLTLGVKIGNFIFF